MSERVVADSTCLIALERIDQIEILPARWAWVLSRAEIPTSVRRPPPARLSWKHLRRMDHRQVSIVQVGGRRPYTIQKNPLALQGRYQRHRLRRWLHSQH